MSFDEAMRLVSRDEAFKATIYAMNTLLIHKSIFTQDEFQQLFAEWVKKEESKKARSRNVMVVSGWKNGRFDTRRPVALGVRIGKENVRRFFDRNWNVVLVEIESEIVPVKVTRTFWTTCPELRSPAIGDWLRKNGLAPWRPGKPPEMHLTPMGRNRFRLEV